MSIEGKIAVLEELIRIRTEKLKVVKERHKRDRLSMASIIESLEADKKELEELKQKQAAEEGERNG